MYKAFPLYSKLSLIFYFLGLTLSPSLKRFAYITSSITYMSRFYRNDIKVIRYSTGLVKGSLIAIAAIAIYISSVIITTLDAILAEESDLL
jgi:hypothetical protein